MANTLNLGNGNWATKEDSLLAYNSENGNFKPLPFDFTRASSATVVNKAGLIETVGSGEPRIDFKDDTKGALLLEPSRSNLITYSEDFSQSSWAKTSASITINSIISPDGSLNASKITEDSTLNNHRISVNGLIGSGTHTITVFAKANDRNWLLIRNAANNAWFDVSNGVVGTVQSGTGSIENYGNGWYRCSVTMLSLSTPAIGISDNNDSYSYQGNGTGSLYIFGAQVEQGSYATSYIPTSGSAVTRVADVCNNGGNEQVINSTEGTIFIDFKFNSAGAIVGINRSFQNMIQIGLTASNGLRCLIYNSGTNITINSSFNLIKNTNYKVAINYKSLNSKMFINGALDVTNTSALSFNAPLEKLEINANYFFNSSSLETKGLAVYNTALTDQELINLTTL